MARIVKEEEYTARRNEILDVAIQLVYSKGYDKMTIQDILDHLHMSKGAFYHYFDSKVAVLEAVVERMATEQVKPMFLAIVQDPKLPALEKLHQYFYMSTSWKTSNKALLTELMQIWYSDQNALARQKLLKMTVEHLGPIFTEIIKQGVQEGTFSTPYPKVASEVTINLIHDLAYASGQMLLSEEVKQSENLRQVETLYAAYSDALERVLGAPKGSIQFMAAEALKVWFSSDDPLQSESFAKESGMPTFPNT
jgi:TetR/AcrR family transcriptional repressor of nem operon